MSHKKKVLLGAALVSALTAGANSAKAAEVEHIFRLDSVVNEAKQAALDKLVERKQDTQTLPIGQNKQSAFAPVERKQAVQTLPIGQNKQNFSTEAKTTQMYKQSLAAGNDEASRGENDDHTESMIQVKVIDDDENGKVLNTQTYIGNQGDKLGSRSTRELIYYMNRGYFLMDRNFSSQTEFTNTIMTYEVHFAHGHQTFSIDHPTQEGNDINRFMDQPKVTKEMADYERKVNTQIVYQGAGSETPKTQTLTADFTREITVDNVTGKIIETTPWQTEDKASFTVPQLDNYKSSIDTINLTPDSPETITVNYTRLTPLYIRTLNFMQDGQSLAQALVQEANNLNELTNTLPVFKGKHVIGIKQGDIYVNDLEALKPDKDSKINATVEYANDDLGQTNPVVITAKSIVHFKDTDGNALCPDSVAQAQFIKSPDTIDLDTNETVTQGIWNHNSYRVNVKVPVINGYLTEMKDKTIFLTLDKPVIEQTIIYHKLGRVSAVDPQGRVLQYTTYPNSDDPATANILTMPEIQGYKAKTKYIIPVDPYANKEVLYTPTDIFTGAEHISKIDLKQIDK